VLHRLTVFCRVLQWVAVVQCGLKDVSVRGIVWQRVVRCVAACCSMLKYVVVLQCARMCCSMLQCVALCYSVLQCVTLC